MDTAENRIKEIIINKYGRLKKFCEIIEMPNVMQISHELKVDTESLASGKIVDYIEKTATKKEESPQIMQYYKQLNDIGKHEATKRVEELTLVPKYVKEDSTYVNAAHAIDGATEEDIQHDEDIMTGEDF